MKKIYLIYGISDCPACLRAQAVLMELDLEYVFIANQNGEELLGGFEDLIYTIERETSSSA